MNYSSNLALFMHLFTIFLQSARPLYKHKNPEKTTTKNKQQKQVNGDEDIDQKQCVLIQVCHSFG